MPGNVGKVDTASKNWKAEASATNSSFVISLLSFNLFDKLEGGSDG